jgi:hypothetical protein
VQGYFYCHALTADEISGMTESPDPKIVELHTQKH